MDYVSTNALSMLGGDDYTTTQEQIADVDARAVHILGNETIIGTKTFQNNLVVNGTTNLNGLLTLGYGGTINGDLLYMDTDRDWLWKTTGAGANTQLVLQDKGSDKLMEFWRVDDVPLVRFNFQRLNPQINITGKLTTTLDVDFAGKIKTVATATTLTNDTTNIISGVNNKLAITGTATTLTNDTTNIISGVDNKLAITGTTTTLNTTDTIIQSGGFNKMTVNATGTVLTNSNINTLAGTVTHNTETLHKINVLTGGVYTEKFSIDNATTTLTNTTTSVKSGANEKINVANAITTLTNTTTNIVSGTTNIVSGTNKLSITGTATTLNNTTTNIQSAGSDRLAITNTITALTGGTFLDLYIGTSKKLAITAAKNLYNSVKHHFTGLLFIGEELATTFPLCNFTLTGTPNDFNVAAFYYNLGGYPDHAITNLVRTFCLPYPAYVRGFVLNGDADTHVAVTLTLTISTGLAGAGTIYYKASGNVAANGMTNNSISINMAGNVVGFTSVLIIEDNVIPAGVKLYCYLSGGATAITTETNIHIYFQQQDGTVIIPG